MRKHERVQIHGHTGLDDGGKISGTVVYQATGGVAGTTGTSGSSTPIPAGTYELATEGGQSVIMAHGSMGAAETFDPTDGNVHTGTLNADCTFTLNAPVGSGACTLELWLTQDGTGGRVITWPGTVAVQGTLDTTAGTTSRVIVQTIDGGTTWVATVVGMGEPTADAHIADTTDAHDATAISIADAGGYFTGTDVEAALQEVAGDVATLIAAGPGGAAGSDHEHMVDVFAGDGSTAAFELTDEPLDPEAVVAYVAGAETAVTMSGAMNTTATFGAAPSAAARVVITYPALVA